MKPNEETNIVNEYNTKLKIPTGGGPISWLFTSMTDELTRVYRNVTLAKWSQWDLNLLHCVTRVYCSLYARISRVH